MRFCCTSGKRDHFFLFALSLAFPRDDVAVSFSLLAAFVFVATFFTLLQHRVNMRSQRMEPNEAQQEQERKRMHECTNEEKERERVREWEMQEKKTLLRLKLFVQPEYQQRQTRFRRRKNEIKTKVSLGICYTWSSYTQLLLQIELFLLSPSRVLFSFVVCSLLLCLFLSFVCVTSVYFPSLLLFFRLSNWWQQCSDESILRWIEGTSGKLWRKNLGWDGNVDKNNRK